MKPQVKIAAAVAAVFVLIVGGLLWTFGRDSGNGPASAEEAESLLIRSDSTVIGKKGSSGVVLVEFLDFECEGCKAAYPEVEKLRKKYEGKVTFVQRYFPMPGHFNGERAARAVESAARQGKYEQMYQKMFENQGTWGEKQEPQDKLFRSYAEDLGLDLKQYDKDYASEEVADRIRRDVRDGTALGVPGTPTFFLDGEKLEPRSADDFTKAIDKALEK